LEAWAADEKELALHRDAGQDTTPVDYQTYRVRPGDTLSGIASTFGATVEDLKRTNNLRNHLIVVGQDLRIPTRLGAATPSLPIEHSIRRGESLEKLAKQYGTSVAQIKELNGLKGDRIHIGEILRIR
jgi:peptidoglycan endopeptidase LytE